MNELLNAVADLRSRVSALERLEPPAPVVAVYSTNAGQSINNNSATIVNFEDSVTDAYSAVTIGAAWKFTAPVAGTYLVAAHVLFNTSTTWAESEFVRLQVYVNGAAGVALSREPGRDTSGGTQYVPGSGVGTVTLAAGDYIDVRVTQTSGGALSLFTDGDYNHVGIYLIR